MSVKRSDDRMKPLIPVLLISCAVLVACERTAPEPTADIVLLNGGIYTVDAERNWVEAAAIQMAVFSWSATTRLPTR